MPEPEGVGSKLPARPVSGNQRWMKVVAQAEVESQVIGGFPVILPIERIGISGPLIILIDCICLRLIRDTR